MINSVNIAATQTPKVLDKLNETGDYNDEIANEMRATLEDFKSKGAW